MNGSITGVRSAQELSDSVATARALERLQEEEVAKVVNAYEKKKSDTTGQIPPDERLSFTTGYQGTVSPGIWYPLLIYIHTAGMKKIVEQLLQKFSKSLGIDPSISTTMSSILLKRETTLKFVPHLEGFTFNPAVSEVKWYEDIQEVNFRLRADADIAGRIVPGSIDIYSGSLLIAQLPISITVRGTNVSEEQPQLTSTTTEIFSSIFASYSHKDAALVEACAAAYKALGISMYIDAISLHSGDIWKRVLQEFIVQSDLFQLYWSDNSSKSNPVQEEWQYALQLKSLKGENFIRPLYWEEPCPTPPTELSDLHFAKLNLDALARHVGHPIDLVEQQPQQQNAGSQPAYADLQAVVLPILTGISEGIIKQAREDASYAVNFLEEVTGLRYYPVPTLLVDNYAVKSVREITTVDLQPENNSQKDRLLDLADILASICLDFHVREFLPKAVSKDHIDNLHHIDGFFGRGRLLTETQFDAIRQMCEGQIGHWIEEYFTPKWHSSLDKLIQSQLPGFYPTRDFSIFVSTFLDTFMLMVQQRNIVRTTTSNLYITVPDIWSINTFPRDQLERVGINVFERQSSWNSLEIELSGKSSAFIVALEALKDNLVQKLAMNDSSDNTRSKPNPTKVETLAIVQTIEAICQGFVANQRGDSGQIASSRGNNDQLTNSQRDLLATESRSLSEWIRNIVDPYWRQELEKLQKLNLSQFHLDSTFTEFVSAFLTTVSLLLHEGLQQLEPFEHESRFSIWERSWNLLQKEIPNLMLSSKPDKYRNNSVNLHGKFSEFVHVFDIISDHLIEALRQTSYLSSNRKWFFAVERPTYGIYAPPTFRDIDQKLQEWAFQHEIAGQLTLPRTPRILLCLDAYQKIVSQFEQDMTHQEKAELAAQFQRCLLIHEHFHAILEGGLDNHHSSAIGPLSVTQWQSALGLNEALAAWMELHFARDYPNVKELVLSYIQAGLYPDWPYRGAEQIEKLYQQEGLEAIRKLISILREAPEVAQTQFDHWVRG